MQVEGKRVLITGGAGFIGSHVTEALSDRGAEVRVLDNFFVGKKEFVPDQVTVEATDIRSEAAVEAIQAFQPHAVVHLAALHYIPYCNENPEETFEVNVMGTRNILQGSRLSDDLQAVVYTSSAAVYPPTDEATPETTPPGPMDIYGRTKLVGEELLKLFHEETGVPATTARLFNVYGRNETNPHLIPAILEQIDGDSEEIELGNLTPRRDFIHTEDVTAAIVRLLETADGYDTFNVGTGSAYSVKQVATHVIEQLDRDMTVVQEQERVRDSDRPHLQADITKIKNDTGWTPTVDLSTGLGRLVDHVVAGHPPSYAE